MNLFRDLTRAFCPVDHDLQRHLARLEAEERQEAFLERRYQYHHATYRLSGDFYDAMGYDNQEADANALYRALLSSDLERARELAEAILNRAADQYAARKTEEDRKAVEAESFHLGIA